jgi:hypothetical protein
VQARIQVVEEPHGVVCKVGDCVVKGLGPVSPRVSPHERSLRRHHVREETGAEGVTDQEHDGPRVVLSAVVTGVSGREGVEGEAASAPLGRV